MMGKYIQWHMLVALFQIQRSVMLLQSWRGRASSCCVGSELFSCILVWQWSYCLYWSILLSKQFLRLQTSVQNLPGGGLRYMAVVWRTSIVYGSGRENSNADALSCNLPICSTWGTPSRRSTNCNCTYKPRRGKKTQLLNKRVEQYNK